MTCMHVEGERWGHTTLASFPGSPLTLTKNKNIIFFRQGEGRTWERGYIQVHLLLCVTAHSPFPGTMVGMATPDWLVAITSG